MMDAETRLFMAADAHMWARQQHDYARTCEILARIDANFQRGHVRPAPRWYQQRDTLFLIAASLFTAGTMASAVMAWGL